MHNKSAKLIALISIFSGTSYAQQVQVDPAGMFSIIIPEVLLPCALSAGALSCPGNNPALTITTATVPMGASVQLMALNAEDSLRKRPNFKLIRKETININGIKAIVQTMTFNNLGNVTLPVVTRTVDAVVGSKTFELEVACNQSTCSSLLGAFDDAIKSLQLSKPGQKLQGQTSASPVNLNNWLKSFKF